MVSLKRSAEPLHVRLADLARASRRAARMRQPPQADARPVAVRLGVMLDEAQRRRACAQVAEHGGLSGRVAQRSWFSVRRLGRLADELQHLHRLQHRLDEIAVVDRRGSSSGASDDHTVPPEGMQLFLTRNSRRVRNDASQRISGQASCIAPSTAPPNACARLRNSCPGGVSSNFRLGISPTPLVFDRADRPVSLRHRWQPADRLLPRHGPDDPRPPAAGGGRGGAPAARARASFSAARARSSSRPRNSSATCCRRPRRCASRSSGTEAVQAALRLAPRRDRPRRGRQVRGPLSRLARQRAVERRARRRTRMGAERCAGARSRHAGPGRLAGQRVEVLSWNRPRLRRGARSRKGDVAAVIMEPAMCATGAIFPRRGLSRRRCARPARGTAPCSIFDEVITGFRVGPGGAQEKLRRHAGRHDLRQGGGERLPGRGRSPARPT